MRCQIVLLAAQGRTRRFIAERLGCSVSWVNRVLARYDKCGLAVLLDRPEGNWHEKLNELFLATL